MGLENLWNNPQKWQVFLKLLRLANGTLRVISTAIIFFVYVLDIGISDRVVWKSEPLILGIGLLIVGQNFLYRLFFIYKESSKSRLVLEILLTILLHLAALLQFEWINISSFSETLENSLTHLLIFLLFFIDLSRLSIGINKLSIHPALIFILSFLILIGVGTLLLKLPNATTSGISWVDAMFTATSAVCVTGLIVVDTATAFTPLGQTFIMVLFQIGGLGMMTFTSFFGFFFKGGQSLQSELFLKDYINEDNIGQVGSTLVKIIVFTLGIEALAAIMIYFSLPEYLFSGMQDQFFFSVFHSISAFCNAGFSTLSLGLYEEGFREQYNVHLILAFSIILGGFGFPVIVAYFQVVKGLFNRWFNLITEKEHFFHHIPRLINVNTKLITYTTIILLIVGFVTYWIFEQDHSLKGLSGYGKVVTAFFGSVTPRTAGFNTVDMRSMAIPTVLIYLILMWIGASPGSTGGGLKTSTFAVAVLNAFSVAKGKDRVEVFKRQLDPDTVNKAFAVILLSFLVIGTGVFLVLWFNPELAILDVAFEIFSAFSTVGLSLGITGQLSVGSKIVVSVIMFLGRVGTLTVLVAFVKKARTLRYKYPREGVFIS